MKYKTTINPSISVITSIYNGEIKNIIICLESIINQSHRDFEFIIINDGSNTLISEFLENFCNIDNRIILIKNEYNIGLTKSLNKGINLAKGDLIARIDSDDFCDKKRLEIQYNFFRLNPSYTLLGTNFTFRKNNYQFDNKYPKKFKNNEIHKILKYKNIYCHSTMMFRKRDILSVGSYNQIFKYAQDYDLWLRVSEKFKCAFINDKLVICELGINTISYKYMIEQKSFAILARINALQRSKYRLSYFLPIFKSIVKCPKAFFWLIKNIKNIKS